MEQYRVPLEDIKAILGVLDLSSVYEAKAVSEELVSAVLDEAAKFMERELAPLNALGDQQQASISDGKVTMPAGFKDAYSAFAQQGWNGVPFDPEYGGQGLPWVVSSAISEMISGANMAFGLCPLLTQGAIELLMHHGSDEQKQRYLPNLVSGHWTGTMCLTEPQAGSDVGALTTKATKTDQGHYLIKGQKIFITYGHHDMTDNIIHMVLARVEGAPEGSKGISLFIVPQIHEDNTENDVRVVSLEHKLGIHASPTCVMAFGDEDRCVGYLVGEENKGLAYMFTMMNNARLAVGVQAIGVGQAALGYAKAFAAERVQMGVSIDQHPDVERMLKLMECQTMISRMLALQMAAFMDEGKDELAAFLTPIVKSYSSEAAFDVCSTAMQVLGGIGYTEEVPISQYLRDCRIAMIYEGTNGIQAQDLVFRKLLRDQGETGVSLIELLEGSDISISQQEALKIYKDVSCLLVKKSNDTKILAAMAHEYLQMSALAIGGCLFDKLSNNNENYSELHAFFQSYMLPQMVLYKTRIEQYS